MNLNLKQKFVLQAISFMDLKFCCMKKKLLKFKCKKTKDWNFCIKTILLPIDILWLFNGGLLPVSSSEKRKFIVKIVTEKNKNNKMK